ncbi:MAG: helix-turn-helix domain-containing protein [Mesorhizobium sp.]|nr:MAG: helix-turn-helix domain-containing protein [Mesorhizobium sp.]
MVCYNRAGPRDDREDHLMEGNHRSAEQEECSENKPDRESSRTSGLFAVNTIRLANADDLREAVQGADLKIVQLAPGPFEGQLTHAQIGTLGLSTGDFEPDIRARGVMNPNLVTIGMMVGSNGEVKQWDYDIVPGDVVVFPGGVEQEGRFTGRSRYVTLTLSEEDLALHSAGEGAISEPDFWTRIYRFRASPLVREFIRWEIANKVAQLRRGLVPETPAAIAYLRRSLVEAFIVSVLDQQATENEDRQRSGSRLVRAVEDYIEGLDRLDPIHISELCIALNVSRRTLHRAFRETLGLGPVEYLRLARLAQVRRRLTSARSGTVNVSQAALEAGFSDLGRFAAYYRRLYGEVPSQTQKFQRWGG